MRKIVLSEHDVNMFDTDMSPYEYEFFHKHRDAFKRMWIVQGKQFWIRFVLSFRSFSVKFGVIKEIPGKQDLYAEYIDQAFIYIHEQFVDGKVNSAKNLVLDSVTLAQNKHAIQFLESRSRAKDPFYCKETRDVFRRLFGPPDEKSSYVKTFLLLPLYVKFGGSTCQCLRRWLLADDQDSSDESYWQPPSAINPNQSVVEKNIKFNIKNENFVDDDDYRCFEEEKLNGRPNGPKFLKGWTSGDPRFNDPSNPLYNKKTCRKSDWRENLDYPKFLDFLNYVRGCPSNLKLTPFNPTETKDNSSDSKMNSSSKSKARETTPVGKKTKIEYIKAYSRHIPDSDEYKARFPAKRYNPDGTKRKVTGKLAHTVLVQTKDLERNIVDEVSIAVRQIVPNEKKKVQHLDACTDTEEDKLLVMKDKDISKILKKNPNTNKGDLVADIIANVIEGNLPGISNSSGPSASANKNHSKLLKSFEMNLNEDGKESNDPDNKIKIEIGTNGPRYCAKDNSDEEEKYINLTMTAHGLPKCFSCCEKHRPCSKCGKQIKVDKNQSCENQRAIDKHQRRRKTCACEKPQSPAKLHSHDKPQSCDKAQSCDKPQSCDQEQVSENEPQYCEKHGLKKCLKCHYKKVTGDSEVTEEVGEVLDQYKQTMSKVQLNHYNQFKGKEEVRERLRQKHKIKKLASQYTIVEDDEYERLTGIKKPDKPEKPSAHSRKIDRILAETRGAKSYARKNDKPDIKPASLSPSPSPPPPPRPSSMRVIRDDEPIYISPFPENTFFYPPPEEQGSTHAEMFAALKGTLSPCGLLNINPLRSRSKDDLSPERQPTTPTKSSKPKDVVSQPSKRNNEKNGLSPQKSAKDEGRFTSPDTKKDWTRKLRACANCKTVEQSAKSFKKCQKCQQLKVKEPRYYCSRDCQAEDWKSKHRKEHMEDLL